MTAEITIAGDHDLDAIHETFATRRRIQVKHFLEPDSADALRAGFDTPTDWYLAYTERGQNVESAMAEIDKLTPEQKRKFQAQIDRTASTGFQFAFPQYYVTEEVKRGTEHALNIANEFVNSEGFLGFMRRLTGVPEIRFADVLASAYGPGHYLTDHDDTHGSRERVAAFVINLTRKWNRNWGGHLVFFDEDGNIEEGMIPTYNCLNVFQIPQAHAVQYVAPFAQGTRTSLTGWVHR